MATQGSLWSGMRDVDFSDSSPSSSNYLMSLQSFLHPAGPQPPRHIEAVTSMQTISIETTTLESATSPVSGDVGLPFFPTYGRAQDVVAVVDAAGAVVVAGVVVVAGLVAAAEDAAAFGLALVAEEFAAFSHAYFSPSSAV
ncbi:uncharacterized protein EDB91DRAFT_1248961 [Suillus paluster]|uniref:uncharacterized protein n=1 Tax=Suillus paluster TaxID=48578 RepID=UPI001B88621F|nr:uncharacterized protein EDB91DRAFT_1248961 [Suillus paluster]KAG1739208.1 hypothetical protein EDB91DRAFT_1248961 [Suillus paluster]